MDADRGDGRPEPGRWSRVGRLAEVEGYRVVRPAGRPEWMFTLTQAGSGRFRAAGEDVVAEPGDLVLVPPWVPQDYAVRRGCGHWDFLWAHAAIRSDVQVLLDASGVQRISVPTSRRPDVEAAFLEALAHRRTDRPVAERLAVNSLERALLLSADAHDLTQGVSPHIARALEHIETNLGDALTLADLARVAGLSVSRFSHVFATEIGTPPREHLERRRMDIAAQLLDVSARPVSSIALAVGFDDPLYFSRRFHRAHGVSPTTYRRQMGHVRP